MGGIVGVLCKERISERSSNPLVQNMMDQLIHRGPDQARITYLDFGSIGYQRLCIVDPDDGWQPFQHPEKPLYLVFNGEIFNYLDLRQQLAARSVTLRTQSDTEVLLMLYDQFGLDMFDKLVGDYALAIWDGEKGELLLARDPMGAKPLYFEMDTVGISFASELSALLAVRGGSKPDFSPLGLQYMLGLGYLPAPLTLFETVYKLPPGHHLIWRAGDGAFNVHRHWHPDQLYHQYIEDNRTITMDQALSEFDARLQQAVKARTRSTTHPIGLFLGGGLNSAVLASVMKRHIDYPLHTFSAGFTGCKEEFDEQRHARKISRELNTVHHEVSLTPQIMDELPQLMWHMDEPIADPGMIALAALGNAAKSEVKIVTTAHGANQILGGCDAYTQYQKVMGLSNSPGLLKPLLSTVSGVMGGKNEDKHWNTPAQLILEGHPAMSVWQTCQNFPQRERQRLMPHMEPIPDALMPAWCQYPLDPFHQLHWNDYARYMPDSMLMGIDKVTMAHSLEARLPFADPQLALWTMSLPESIKVQQGVGKHLMRQYAGEDIPKSIVKRPHKPLTLPLMEWLWPRLDDIEISLIRSALVQDTGLFSTNYIQTMLLQLHHGELRTLQPLWNLIVLKTWYDVFVKCNTKSDIRTLQALSRNF